MTDTFTYKLLGQDFNNNNSQYIIRKPDKACIPLDPANTDYQEYLEWVAEGNTPDPAE